jgi:SynChlorMet cassette protein ScmC
MMYAFCLSDNQYWGIESAEDTREWADEFARLLGLEPSEGCPDRMIRLERLASQYGCPWVPPHGYPGEEWRVRVLYSLEDWRHPDVQDIIFRLRRTEHPGQVKLQMIQTLLPVYESTVFAGGLPLHAALVEHDRRGVLLVGRSGVGKSTACRRLPPWWNVLCDDTALAVRTSDGGCRVHPLPTWSVVTVGSGEQIWDIRQSVRLSAVFFLTQAAQDEVLPAGRAMASVVLADAAMTIFNTVKVSTRAFEPSPLRGDIFTNAASMANSIPSYILRLTLEGRFWEKIEEVLERQDLRASIGA